MVIWSGWGILIALIYIFSLAGAEGVVNGMLQDPYYYELNAWPKVLGGVIGTLLVWLFVRWLEKKPKRVVIDKLTGEELRLGRKNHLFYIPAKYWPYILSVVTLSLAFV